MKKVICLLLSLSLIICSLTLSVSAAQLSPAIQVGSTIYNNDSDFVPAIEASSETDTIKLLRDIDLTSVYARGAGNNVCLKNRTLDLNGYTLKMRNAAIWFVGENMVIKNGTVISAPTAGKTSYEDLDSYSLLFGDDGINAVNNALVENVTGKGGFCFYNGRNITVKNCNVKGTKYHVISAEENTDVTIIGGTYESTCREGDKIVAFRTIYQGATDSRIKIKSGTFTINSPTDLVYGNLTIEGGTFNIDPSAYLAFNTNVINLPDNYIVMRLPRLGGIGNQQNIGGAIEEPVEEVETEPVEAEVDLGCGTVSVAYGNETIVFNEKTFVNEIDEITNNAVIDYSKSNVEINNVILNHSVINKIEKENENLEIKSKNAYVVIEEIENTSNSVAINFGTGIATYSQKKAMETDEIIAEVSYGIKSNGKAIDSKAKIYVPCAYKNVRVFYLFNEGKIGIVPCQVIDGYCMFDKYFDGTYVICK